LSKQAASKGKERHRRAERRRGCVVIIWQVKTQETDGYSAVQVGYKVSKEKHINKPELGHLAKAGAEPLRHLAEWRVS
jgi:ribosomal protein L3